MTPDDQAKVLDIIRREWAPPHDALTGDVSDVILVWSSQVRDGVPPTTARADRLTDVFGWYWQVAIDGPLFVGVRPMDYDERMLLHRLSGAPTLSIEEGIDHDRPPPHCDQRILHPAGECEFCDARDDLRAERVRLDVSDTGTNNRRWPCPADVARPYETHQQWRGNRAWSKL